MALTFTYSIDDVIPKTPVPTFAGLAGSDSDTVGFSNGGWATSVVDTSGFSDISFYNKAGTLLTTDVGFSSTHGTLAQLTNGNVVAVGTASGGGINFHIDTSTGGFVGSGSVTATTTETNADVAALAGGGFVVVDQRSFAAPDNDIEIHVRDAAGNVVTDFSVTGSADNDQNASVAGLADGGFAVAFERIDGVGNTTAWLAVYNADGTTRLGPTLFDGAGTVNTHMNVTALQSGGFSVGYEDNGWGNGLDITVATFDANGVNQNFNHTSELTTDDSEAAVTTLSNGLVVSTFTNNHNNGGDLDILATVVGPLNGGSLTSSSDPVHIDFSSEVTSDSSVSALDLARFAVSYTNADTSAVDVATFQLVRHGTGTAGADTFTGDDAVNLLNGLGGDDVLSGGNNDDTINGGAGNDKLFGLGGDDVLTGSIGDDVLNGGAGADTANYSSNTTAVTVNLSLVGAQNTGGAGVDSLISIQNLIGGSAGDTLTGNALNNQIKGQAGFDIITGLAGGDTLTGGTGVDTFIYTALADTGLTGATRDRITDFVHNSDSMDLSALDANTTLAGNQAFSYIGVANFSGVAGQLHTTHVGAFTYVEGDVNGDAVKDFQIQLFGNISVAATDFVL